VDTPEFLLDRDLASRLESDGLDFLIEFLTVAVRERPENVDALAELGHALSRSGRFAEGLAIDERLVRLVPENPEAHYNLACSLALTGAPEAALDTLAHAIELGYSDVDHLEGDDDLASLRSHARYAELVARLRAPRG